MSYLRGLITRYTVDVLTLFAVIGLAVIVYALEFFASNITPREERLFGAVEFFLAIAIGWLSQKINSREEFQKSLKQYALSAYRRINDIDRFIARIQSEIRHRQSSYSADSMHDLDVLGISVEGLRYAVASSIVDWADIIGEELKKVEQIELLQEEQRSTAKTGQNTEQMDELQKEIERLRADLPWKLRSLVEEPKDDVMPRGGYLSPTVRDFFLNSISRDGFIHLPVEPFESFCKPSKDPLLGEASGLFGARLSEEGIERIKSLAPYSLFEDVAAGSSYLVLCGKDGEEIGLVKNPLDTAGIYYRDFIVTLFELLPKRPAELFDGRYQLPDAEFEKEDPLEGDRFFVRVPVNRKHQTGDHQKVETTR